MSALSPAWGTTRTAAGRAVWCELPLVPDDSRRRMQRVTTVIETYGLAVGSSTVRLTHRPVLEGAAASLIPDLLYWLTAHGLDPDDVLDRAHTHFEECSSSVTGPVLLP